MPAIIRADLDHYAARLREMGLRLTDGELMIAGLVALWDLTPDQQLEIIQRARNYDIQRMKRGQVERVEVAAEAGKKVEQDLAKAQRESEAAKRKKARG